MNFLSAATLVLGLAVCVQAQTKNTKLQSALETTRTAMNDQGDSNAVGIKILAKLDGDKIAVVFADQKDVAVTVPAEKGGLVISLSDKLPAYPRPICAALAREAAELMTKEMARTAEREFMRVSLRARAWLELGGEYAKLPMLETLKGAEYKNEELAQNMKLWIENNSAAALSAIGKATGAPGMQGELSDVEAALEKLQPGSSKRPALEAKRKALEADLKKYVEFALSEREWRQVNGYLLPQPKKK